jgi:hypothetical protein
MANLNFTMGPYSTEVSLNLLGLRFLLGQTGWKRGDNGIDCGVSGSSLGKSLYLSPSNLDSSESSQPCKFRAIIAPMKLLISFS